MSTATSSRKWHAAALLAVLLAAGCATSRGVRGSYVDGRDARNGTMQTGAGLGFRFQPFDEPTLDKLRDRENLTRVVDGRRTQFEQIIQLRDWVSSQWPLGAPTPYPPWNAMTVLDWIREGRTGGHCGQYSQVFLQSLASLGFTARYVEVGQRDNPYAHFVTEVWSNDFDKWVVMDADYNMYFERDGLPMSALEIHDAVVRSELKYVKPRIGTQRKGHVRARAYPFRTAELYYYLRFHLKADHLSRPDEPPMDRFNDMVEWADELTVPWEKSVVTSEYPKDRLTKRSTSDRLLAQPPMNQVELSADVSASTAVIALRHNVLQLSGYEYRIVGADPKAQWQSFTTPRLELPRGLRDEAVMVRGVNIRGIRGPASTVSIPSTR